MEVPCYQDENGKIYFDENNGRNGLDFIRVLIWIVEKFAENLATE